MRIYLFYRAFWGKDRKTQIIQLIVLSLLLMLIVRENKHCYLKRQKDVSDFFQWTNQQINTIFIHSIVTHTLGDLLHTLKQHFPNSEVEIAKKLRNVTFLNPTQLSITTIGIYYPRMSHGGIERGIQLQIALFLQLRYKVILFTDTFSPEREFPINASVTRIVLSDSFSTRRWEALSKSIELYRINVMIYHAHISPHLLYDMIVVKSQGVFFVVYRHGTIIHYFNDRGQWRTRRYYHIYRMSDRVLVLSKMEEVFLRAMDVSVQYLPNPIQFSDISPNYQLNEGIVLWVGRLSAREKNYMAALKIMKEVIRNHATALLVLVGPEQTKGAGSEVRSYIRRNYLEKNVRWVAASDNISLWYSRAKIHLVTSPYEAFPMVIVESKSFAIPLVLFSLPGVEFLRDGKGYISVPQNDISGAAAAISRLLNNDDLCNRLSKDAYKSLDPFRQFNQTNAWNNLFTDLLQTMGIPRQKQVCIDQYETANLLETILGEAALLRGHG